MRVELDTAEESANEPRGLELSELSREFFMDQNVVIAVLDLLAHWWSRPVAEEVEIWLGARELEEELLTTCPGKPRVALGEDRRRQRHGRRVRGALHRAWSRSLFSLRVVLEKRRLNRHSTHAHGSVHCGPQPPVWGNGSRSYSPLG